MYNQKIDRMNQNYQHILNMVKELILTYNLSSGLSKKQIKAIQNSLSLLNNIDK
jgi:hypothetical protein